MIDAFGKISVYLTDSYDLGWMSNNGGQPIPYRVEAHLSGSKHLLLHDHQGAVPFDLSDSIPPDDSGIIVVQENEVEVGAVEPARFEIFADTSTIYPVIP